MMQIDCIRYAPHAIPSSSSLPECLCRRGPEVEYEWQIKNFSMCPQSKGQALESTLFTIDSLNQSKFKLVLYPRGLDEGEEDNVVCFLECLTEPDYNINVVLTVLGSSKSVTVTKSKECFVLCGGQRIGFVLLSDRQESVTRNFAFLLDDVFTIRCVLVPEYRSPFVCNDFLAISGDYSKLLESGDFSDFEIEGRNGEKYRVHKLILTIRCHHLAKRMGLLDDKSISKGTIRDMNSPALRALLDYLYSGNLSDNLAPDVLSEVYEAVKRYNMDNLKRDAFPLETRTIAYTIVKVDRRTISWDLQGFHPYGLRYGDVDWPIRTFVDLTHGRFMITFSVKLGGDDKPLVQIDIYCQSLMVDGKVLVRCNVLLDLKESGPKPEFCSGEHFFDESNSETRTLSMVADLDTLNSLVSLRQYPDIVTFVFHLALSSTESSSECQKVEVSSSLVNTNPCNISYQALSSDLDKVFRHAINEDRFPQNADWCPTGTFSDLLIESQSGKLIPAHKCVLAARSSEFRELLERNGNSSEPANLNLTNLSDETLEDLLRYVYSGNVIDINLRRVMQLYFAAIKYKIPALLKICTYLMKTKMTESDIYVLMLLAEDNKDENLLSVVQHYIRMNKIKVLGPEDYENDFRESCTRFESP